MLSRLQFSAVPGTSQSMRQIDRSVAVRSRSGSASSARNGGTLVMLAAMTSSRFRAAAALSGLVDASAIHGDPIEVPFDQANPEEYRMRSARRARAAGRDVEAVRVPGDHEAMRAAALPLVIELFRRH
jgi:hypothetical protein